MNPDCIPFTYQMYRGEEPPFTAAAVNSTVSPWHTGFAEAEIVIPADSVEAIDM